MRINIAAAHRFHLLDLARELEKKGHEVCFYSYVPTKRAIKFGLKKKCSFSFFYFMIPLLVIWRLTRGSSWSTKLLHLAMDYYMVFFMKPCDVYIALGAIYKRSFDLAKNKYGAITILEWGSKHIIAQEDSIKMGAGFNKGDDYFIRRSLEGYQIADYISIPSLHVKDSFIENNTPKSKLIINPYGVDLKMFPSTSLNNKSVYDVLMVGSWSYTKGCDLLNEFFQKYNYTLLHVGTIKDVHFPNVKNMTHIDHVDQAELKEFYSKARVFVLPSRSDGFGMVLSQALACGLPIVCSKNTGGRDLRTLLNDKRWVIEMDNFSITALKACIDNALKLAGIQQEPRNYAGDCIYKLTWEAYGERYSNSITNL